MLSPAVVAGPFFFGVIFHADRPCNVTGLCWSVLLWMEESRATENSL